MSSYRLTGHKRRQRPDDIEMDSSNNNLNESLNIPISHEWIKNILKEKNLSDYDPNVVHILSEFIHNYLKTILKGIILIKIN